MNFWPFIWVLIPLAGIMAGMWSEWLKFKEKQARLGSTAESLESSFEELSGQLKAQNEALIKRIQNLEAIVTSADWDRLTGQGAPQALPEPEPEPEILIPDPQEEIREEAEKLARRIQS